MRLESLFPVLQKRFVYKCARADFPSIIDRYHSVNYVIFKLQVPEGCEIKQKKKRDVSIEGNGEKRLSRFEKRRHISFSIYSSFVSHVAYAVGKELFPRHFSHPGAHGQHRTRHYANNATRETNEGTDKGRSHANAIRCWVYTCKKKIPRSSQ